MCPLGVVVLRRGFPLAKFVNDECGLESSARPHEIPNKKLESFRCTEIGIGPVEGRSASSILQFLNLAEGTLSVKGLVASGELKSADSTRPVFRACARRRSQRQAFLDFTKPNLRCVNSMTDLRDATDAP